MRELDPPTVTLWSVDMMDVGAADPGYDAYVVVASCVPDTVTVAVTVTGAVFDGGEGGVEGGVDEEEEEDEAEGGGTV